MAKELWFATQEFPVGDTLVNDERIVNPSMDSVDGTVLVAGTDWLTVAGRTIKIVIEQSLDGGATWQHWVDSGDIPTGRLPRSGVIVFGISSSQLITRKIRPRVFVTGAPVTFGLEFDITRRASGN